MLAQCARARGRLAGKQSRGVSGRERRAARPRALEWEGERAGAEEAGADHGPQVTVAGAMRGALGSVCRRGGESRALLGCLCASCAGLGCASGPRVGEGKRKVGRRWLEFWAGLVFLLFWFFSSPFLFQTIFN